MTTNELLGIAASAGTIEEANKIAGGFGVEYVAVAGREIAYVNMGDTYAETICQEGDGPLFVSSWGDWIEQAEQAHCEEEDVIRCGYCGEFTPLCEAAMAQPAGNRPAWRDTVCEHCGHNVAG